MIHFKIRDYLSVLLYRALAPLFGRLGKRTRIVWPLRIVGARFCDLADNVTIQTGAYIAVLPLHAEPPVLKVGKRTMIGNHAHIVATRRVEFGEAVLTADRLFVADNGHEYSDPGRPVLDQGLRQLGDVHIGDGTWIGENVCIIGCRIGRNCVIAANSVVTHDVPDHCMVAGAPARIVKRYCSDRKAWVSVNEGKGLLQ